MYYVTKLLSLQQIIKNIIMSSFTFYFHVKPWNSAHLNSEQALGSAQQSHGGWWLPYQTMNVKGYITWYLGAYKHAPLSCVQCSAAGEDGEIYLFRPHWKKMGTSLEFGASYQYQVGFTKLSPPFRFWLTNNLATQPDRSELIPDGSQNRSHRTNWANPNSHSSSQSICKVSIQPRFRGMTQGRGRMKLTLWMIPVDFLSLRIRVNAQPGPRPVAGLVQTHRSCHSWREVWPKHPQFRGAVLKAPPPFTCSQRLTPPPTSWRQLQLANLSPHWLGCLLCIFIQPWPPTHPPDL